jgi:hypothetical protein
MDKQTISVGVANEKEKNIDVEELKTWTPKNISYFSDTVYFKYDGTYYSIKRLDYDKIFNQKKG